MSTFSVDQIVGKGLIADKTVNLYSDSSLTNLVKTVTPGNPVGMVYSYIQPTSGNGAGKLLWMISNTGNYAVPYLYVVHQKGDFKEPVLALSQEEILQQQKDEANKNDIGYQILRVGKPLVITAGIIWAITKLGSTYIQEKIN